MPEHHADEFDEADDGLDDGVWARLLVIVHAANRADAHAYVGEVMRWRHNFALPGQHRMGIYLKYILSYRVKEVLRQNQPTDKDLHDIAAGSYGRVHQVLDRATVIELEETVRTAFDRPSLGGGVTPGQFMVFAGAILGVLMNDPDREVEEIRPRLAAWWQRHYDTFRTQGLLG
jgi:hypothetical protein